MRRIFGFAALAFSAALPAGLLSAAGSNDAQATTLVFFSNPMVTIDEAPAQVKKGKRFVVRGSATPGGQPDSSRLFVAIPQQKRDGSQDVKRSTSIFVCIPNGEIVPFEIIGRASSHSSGVIFVGATVVSGDPEFPDGNLLDFDDAEIPIVRRLRTH